MKTKRKCKTCGKWFATEEPGVFRCELHQEQFEKWLDDSSPGCYYSPRRDGAYWEDE